MDLHSLSPSSPWAFLVLTATLLACVGGLFGMGWLLVPSRCLRGNKLLRLSIQLASGLVFATGFSALFCLRHLNYMTWLAIGQAAVAVWLWRKPVTIAAGDFGEETWTWKEAGGLLLILAVLLPVFQIPYQYADADGRVQQLHADLGYFVDIVVALPESQAANGWSIFMGKDSAAACGVQDAWYHWGSLMLAVGIRAVTGLPAAAVLLGVVNMLLNVMLVLTAAALARSVTRLRVLQATLAGAAAITCINLLRMPQIIEMLALWLPYDIFHHARVPLGLIFPYKFEGVLVLAALALWQSGYGKAALGMVFLAACSAPHTVAAGGAAMATLAGLGVIRRDRGMFVTGTLATVALLAGWAVVHFVFGSSLPAPKSESIVGFIGWAQIWKSIQHGLLDAVVTLVMSALLLAGAVFLIVRGRREGRAEQSLLGWLCIAAVVGSSLALQGMRSADRFHVVVMTHAVLIMPVCACGLVAMLRHFEGINRRVALGLLTAVTFMGSHTLLMPVVSRQDETWDLKSLAEVRQLTQGQPVGYFAKADRNWWISKHGLLGGLLESRIVRLNPLDERNTSHFSEAAYKIPFEWLPPAKDEPSSEWSIRLAKKLGIRHVLETWEDKLPRKVREQSKPVWAGPGLMLYELPGTEDERQQVGEVRK
jgi:hypothetical protein